jgi:hypothetical protein
MVSVAIAAVLAGSPLLAQHKAPTRPNLEGTWNGSTLTPLQRPADFKDKATFTPEEAAEYVRTAPDRARSRLRSAADRLTQADVDETYVESEAMKIDRLRTSLIVDPPNGILPPLLPAALARIADQAQKNVRGSRDFQPVGTMPARQLRPGRVDGIPAAAPERSHTGYYQIVQTDGYVLILRNGCTMHESSA